LQVVRIDEKEKKEGRSVEDEGQVNLICDRPHLSWQITFLFGVIILRLSPTGELERGFVVALIA
jgi:hypothetical protein